MLLSFFLSGNRTKAQTIQIGNGTTITGTSGPAPVNINTNYLHVQYLFTVAELNALGITGPQKIDSIGFKVVGAPNDVLPNYTIKMAGTGLTDLGATPYNGVFTTVCSLAAFTPAAASWNMLGFSTAFAWNGLDNIVVDICFGKVVTRSGTGTVEYTATTGPTSWYTGSNGTALCSQFSGTATVNRPNIKFHFTPYTACTGAPVIKAQTGSPLNICAGGSPYLFVKTDTIGGYTYQWESSSTGAAPWTSISGATNAAYSAPTAASNYYRAVVTCSGTGLTTTSAPVQVVSTPPSYAALPYFQDFENWQNYCDTLDIPAGNWSNRPAHGNSSWRRNDQGTKAGWYGTGGMYSPVAKSGNYSACFSTNSQQNAIQNGLAATALPGNLDLYLNCSGSAGPKQLYFYMFNAFTSSKKGDTLSVLLSTDGGNSFSLLATFDTATAWTRKLVAIPSSSAQTIIRFSAWRSSVDYSNIGLDSVYVADACNGQPTAGVISPAGPLTGCAGYGQTLAVNGTSLAGNLFYQWIQKTNSATTWTNAIGTGANTVFFNTPALFDTIQYRMVVTCLGSNLRDTTAPVTINVQRPVYASIPFVEDFESWMTRCASSDNPSASWLNYPNTGNNSWRRNDQGASASWSPLSPAAFTAAPHGSYSARFHSIATANGYMNLYLDCSSTPGNKELQFYHINANGADTLRVQLSTDGGATFTNIGVYTVANSWIQDSIQFASNSAQTVIRFLGRPDQGSTDMGLDYVRVVALCYGTPAAGTVVPVTPCVNTDFQLALQNNTMAAGVSYQWQQNAGGVWTSTGINNAGQLVGTGNIAAPTSFRCIVTCNASGLSDTTPVYQVNLAPFYQCYCRSTAGNTSRCDIGNVTVATNNATVILNNGIAVPVTGNAGGNQLYTDFRATLTPTMLYRNSLYHISVSQITPDTTIGAATVAAYIDYNANGIFESTEQLFKQNTSAGTPYVQGSFTVPANASLGLTGMRVVMIDGASVAIDPCGTYSFGETEDYLVTIHYPTCDGPTNPGTAVASAISVCKGYTFKLTDTTHQKNQSNITWNWQESTSNGSMWNDIPGSVAVDTITQTMNGVIWYRLQMICLASHDTAYSNVVKISETPYYKCYCYSTATGGTADSSDIGAFSFAGFVVNTGGPHQLNPQATNGRVDYTDLTPIELYEDSTYTMNLYHTMKSKYHANARVTMFMDFNNNVAYDVPAERINLANNVTTLTGWYLINNVTIPHGITLNTPTGMRVILNNDVTPNTPSDDACGAYTSGETADFVVIFRRATPTAITNLTNINDFALYPNPTPGRFTVRFKTANTIHDLQISVRNVTGQLLSQQHFSDIGNQFSKVFDLTAEASGMYFVEVQADGERTIQKVIIR